MKKEFSNKIISVVMLAVILVSMLNFPFWIIEKLSEDVVLEKIVTETENTEDIVAETDTNTISNNRSIFNSFLNVFEMLTSEIESATLNVSFELTYVKLNTIVQMIAGRSVFPDGSNGVIELDNGYLTTTIDKCEYVSEYAENLIELQYFLDEKEIDLLYIQAPFKISKYDDELPAGVYDYSNENADEFLSAIDGVVNYIDLREEMYIAGEDQYDFFFKTDHHWTAEGAFWAFEKVAYTLNKDYGFDIDESYYNIENYNIETFEDWFLGSWGKRVGTFLVGVDDFSILTPNFDTDFTFEVSSEDIFKTGVFEETLLDYSKIETLDYYNSDPYNVFTGACSSLKEITNNLNVEGKRILLVQDSFAKPFATYLSLTCSELDMLDLRYYDEENLTDYISDNEYYIVLFLYNSGIYSESVESMFCFD